MFASKEADITVEDEKENNWKILVVDDDNDVHTVTKLALDNFSFQNRSLEIIDAYSAEEAKKIMSDQSDIALILLDVIMENNHSGLEVVKHVREVEKNQNVRIILRTGQPGEAPEKDVILTYGIDGYIIKTSITVDKLFSTIVSGLRAYTTIKELEKKNIELLKALEEIKTLKEILPICSNCKKIRDDEGYWNNVENYISENTNITFSHGICPNCADELYSDNDWYEEYKKKRDKNKKPGETKKC